MTNYNHDFRCKQLEISPIKEKWKYLKKRVNDGQTISHTGMDKTSLYTNFRTLFVHPGGWVAVQFTSDVIRTIVRRRHQLALLRNT